MQLTLDLLLPSDSRPQGPHWSELDPAASAEAIAILARLITQASAIQKEEPSHDD